MYVGYALAAALVWSLDRNRRDYRKLEAWLWLAVSLQLFETPANGCDVC